MREKLFEVDFRDREKVERYFKPRLDWHPFGTGSKTFYTDWSYANENIVRLENGMLKHIEPDNVSWGPDGMTLSAVNMPVINTIDWGPHEFCYKGAEVVTRDYFENARFELVADVPVNDHTVPAMWFLAVSRWVSGGIHVIKPEFDSHEFGVEHFPTDLNCAFHYNYLYEKYGDLSEDYKRRIDKMSWWDKRYFSGDKQHQENFSILEYDYSGEHTYWAEITPNFFIAGFDGEEIWRCYRPRKWRVPMYGIIWLAVPNWAKLDDEEEVRMLLKNFSVYAHERRSFISV